MIHEAFSKTELAWRYYQKLYPDKSYPRLQAQKKFWDDERRGAIQVEVLKEVVKEVSALQITLLKEHKK